jgi:hypothetical protein
VSAAASAPIEGGVEFLIGTATTSAIRDGDQHGGVRAVRHSRVALVMWSALTSPNTTRRRSSPSRMA